MNKNFELQTQAVAPYALFIFLLLILTIVGTSQFYSRFVGLQTRISDASSQGTLLRQRLLTLEQLNKGTLSFSDAAYLALPNYNPSLLDISQIKRQAKNFDVAINDLRVSSSVKESQDLSNIRIDLKANGSYTSVINFVKKIGEQAPIMNVDSLKIEENLPNFQVTLGLISYWSPLPTQLPALTESVVGFSQDELDILDTLSKLEAPLFNLDTNASNSSSPRTNSDPFVTQ